MIWCLACSTNGRSPAEEVGLQATWKIIGATVKGSWKKHGREKKHGVISWAVGGED